MKSLRQAKEDFLRGRQALGYKLVRHSFYLRDFVSFLEARNTTFITTALALEWTKRTTGKKINTLASRLGIIRQFAKYRILADKRTEVPPEKFFPWRSIRRHPYIYSRNEIARLMVAAQTPSWEPCGIDQQTLYTVIGLAASTGLRRGELVNLNQEDVDLTKGILAIKMTKFGKSRFVPIHPTVSRKLGNYVQYRDEKHPKLNTNAFFISMKGLRVSTVSLNTSFRRASWSAGLVNPDVPSPRLHDLRHTFAVKTLINWLRASVDIDAKVPALSAYLGHLKPKDTYWYFTCDPQLMKLAKARMEQKAEVVL